jgi:hypothetical protein
MNDNQRRGVRPEDVRKAIRSWAILLGSAAALFLGAALLTAE